MGETSKEAEKKRKAAVAAAAAAHARGVASRGIPYRPESNAFKPNIVPNIPGKSYKLVGLRTDQPATADPEVAKKLNEVYEEWSKAPGAQLLVTGSTSKSVVPGVDDAGLQRRRAAAVKDYFVKKGVPPGRIKTAAFGPNHQDPRAVSPESKAAMRGATIEILKPEPPHPPPHPIGYYPDDTPLVPGEVKKPPPPPPPSDPWDFHWPRWLTPRRRRDDDDDGPWPVFDNNDNPIYFILGGVTYVATFGFLDIYLADVAAEYGPELGKLFKKYVKKKIKHGPNERNGIDEERFMRIMLNKILARGLDPATRHPLYFLVNFGKEDWISRHVYHPKGVNAGHVLSRGEYGFSFAIEDSFHNQRIRGSAESGNIPVYSAPGLIGGVPVDGHTALLYESKGWLPKGSFAAAPKTVGWINWLRVGEEIAKETLKK